MLVTVLAVALVVSIAVGGARASTSVRYGMQDDAWLAFGPGTLVRRLDTLDRLGVKLVRYTIRWDQVAAVRPEVPESSDDAAYDWGAADELLKGLHARGIAVVLDVWGSPRWANGGKAANRVPLRGQDFAKFTLAVHDRYPWVRDWLIWSEPNKAPFMQPVSAKLYVQRLLNPAYRALHAANHRVRIGGGVTGPRAGSGGMSPIAFLRGMRAAHAKLDAYAHNPYPERPRIESPNSGGCARCATITMATLGKLLRETQRAWRGKRIWLTEYGYQTNPPDRILGVSPSTQARYLGQAALRVYQAPRVDMLIHFIVRDEKHRAGWQSGLFFASGRAKPASNAWRFPLAQVSRHGSRTVLWGQIRPRARTRLYRLQYFRHAWRWLGGRARTNARGYFRRTVKLGRGSKVRVYSPRDRAFSPPLVLR